MLWAFPKVSEETETDVEWKNLSFRLFFLLLLKSTGNSREQCSSNFIDPAPEPILVFGVNQQIGREKRRSHVGKNLSFVALRGWKSLAEENNRNVLRFFPCGFQTCSTRKIFFFSWEFSRHFFAFFVQLEFG